MMWQTPALGMAAQAFLLTLSLGGDTAALARGLSAGLSAVLAVMTMQLMAKHRYHERHDALMLEQIELKQGFVNLLGQAPHARRPSSTASRSRLGRACIACYRVSSYRLWMVGQTAFLVVSVLVLVLALTDRSGLLVTT